MDLISVDTRSPERLEASTARVRALIELWRTRHEKLAEYAPKEVAPAETKESTFALEERPERTPIWTALPVVLDRTARNTWRLPDLFWTRQACSFRFSTDI